MNKYYIVVKLHYVGEMYSVSGPYDTFEEAESDFDFQYSMLSSSLGTSEYLAIVCR